MNEMIAAARPLLEVLYFLAGIALAATVLIGFRQITLIKRDIRTRNQRAAAEKAIDAADAYFNKYIPLTSTFFAECNEKKLKSYDGPIGDFSFESLSDAAQKKGLERFRLMSWLASMNQLEAIAATFVSGVADENTGYKIIAHTFCNEIERKYDLLAVSRFKRDDHKYWPSIVALYKLWRPRMQRTTLEATHADLVARIDRLSSSPPQPPIGAD